MEAADFTITRNPVPDERSPEEQMLADTTSEHLGRRVLGVVIGSEPPGVPRRQVVIGVAVTPWNLWHFNKRREAALAALHAKVQPDARVQLVRFPMATTFKLYLESLRYRGSVE